MAPAHSYGSNITFQIETDRLGHITAANPPAQSFYRIDLSNTPKAHISDVLPLRHKLAREDILSVYHSVDQGEDIHASLQEGQRVSFLGDRIIWSYKAPAKVIRPWWNTMAELPVSILLVSFDGHVLEMSNFAKRELQNADTSCMALMFESLGRPMAGWLNEIYENRATSHSEFVKLVGDNRYYQLQVSSSPEPSMLLVFMHDITEMKQIEQQFLQSQKMQAIGQLAGGVAHDFNNLLTAVSGHAELLLMRHGSDDPSYADLMQIRHNTHRAAALVRQLLAFSRKQNLQSTRIEVQTVFDDLAMLLKTLIGDKAQLSINVSPDIGYLYTDRQQLEQCIINLVVNARDAVSQNGQITIEAHNLHVLSSIQRHKATVPKGEYIEVRIRDNGTGMPEHILHEIFTPFFTTKGVGEGTGLGLSMVYGFVKQSGGYIFAESTVGEGSDFTLLFPAGTQMPEEQTVDVKPVNINRFIKSRVLLVEDEIPVRLFAARALRHAGHEVVEASSAEEALECLREDDEPFNVMISDVIMPGTQDVSWVAAALALHPGLPVVFASGYPEETFSIQRERLPPTWFLSKPYSLKEITNIVSAVQST